MPQPDKITIEDYLTHYQGATLLDVRSPGEYERGHIPGAINTPLFENTERAEVGTLYKQKGHDAAVLRGLEIVGPKMAGWVRLANHLRKPEHPLIVHCWRGGMRSESFAWLMRTGGIQTLSIVGGYKSWRRWALKVFERPLKILIIGGETGSGKTELLKQLHLAGQQVIDLEGLASHRGSSFGALGLAPQPTVEHFENLLAWQIEQLDPSQPVWVEDESHAVGRVFIPMPFWQQMQQAKVLVVRAPFEERVQRLVNEYGHFPKEDLLEAIQRIRKRLGGLDAQLATEALTAGELAKVAAITLKYYDRAYQYQLAARAEGQLIPVSDWQSDPAQMAKALIAASAELF